MMKTINPDLWKKFDELLSSLKNSKIAIFHDADPDGTCSAALLATAIMRHRGSPPEIHIAPDGGERFLPDETIAFLKSKKINMLLTTDISLDEHPEQVRKAAEFCTVVIIDHHKLYNTFNEKNILLLKPQLIEEGVEPSRYCSSKMVYDLCMRTTDISDKDWVAAVGMISDMTGEQWQEFLSEVCAKYNYSTKNARKSSEWFDTKLGKISKIINSAEVYDFKNAGKCYDVLFLAPHPKEVFSSELMKYEKEVTAEIKKFLAQMNKKAQFIDDIQLVYYQIKPKLNIKSALCTLASLKYPNKTVIVASTSNGRAQVSARRQDGKIAVNDLCEQATKTFLNANAGGHKQAAGATFPARYLDIFKKYVINILEKRKI